MADPYDDTPEAPPATPAFAPTVVEPPVADVNRAEGYLRQHAERAKKYGANYDDIMRQRKDAVSSVQKTLNDTIQEMRDKHEGKGPGQINLPLMALASGMLSGTGPGAGNFGAQVGRGLGAMGQTIQKQRMGDSEFLKGVAELQAKSGEMGDIPLKDAALLARQQQLQEQRGADALEKGIVTSKADQPKSLGKDAMGNAIIFDPKANNGTGAIIGAGGKPLDLDHNKVALDANGQPLMGDDFKKALRAQDPTLAAAVEGYANYENPIPQGSRSPAMTAYNQYLFSLAKRANPDFDIKQYATIQKGMKDWTGHGALKERQNQGQTAVAHLDNLHQAGANLDNSDLMFINKTANWMTTNGGGSRVAEFRASLLPLVEEMTKFLGGGKAAEGTKEEWLKTINEAQSPAALQGAINRFVNIMHGQFDTLARAKTSDLGGKHQYTTDEVLGDEAAAIIPRVLKNDIGTPGGAMAARRDGDNKKRQLMKQEPLPQTSPEAWEKDIGILKKAPSLQNRAYFDQTYGAGTAAKLLGK